MIFYPILIAAIGVGLLEGSEIAMLTIAAGARYRWKNAWLVLFIALLMIIPLLTVLYLFFIIISIKIATILSAIIIFGLGAHFFYEGYKARKSSEYRLRQEEEEKVGYGLIGVYTAILFEEIEACTIVISIAVAAGGAYLPAVSGMVIGLIIPLLGIKIFKPLIQNLPEWLIQLVVGAIMMIVAVLVLLFHF